VNFEFRSRSMPETSTTLYAHNTCTAVDIFSVYRLRFNWIPSLNVHGSTLGMRAEGFRFLNILNSLLI
jgi:hypothetical protein